eukprot:gene37161-45103_t
MRSSKPWRYFGVFILVIVIAVIVVELWHLIPEKNATDWPQGSGRFVNVHFNVISKDISCQYATIELQDSEGSRVEGITIDLAKWNVDEKGVLTKAKTDHSFAHISNNDKRTAWEHVVALNAVSLDAWLDSHEYTFVDFYTPWCTWCQRMQATWDDLGGVVSKQGLPISIAAVDCDADAATREICAKKHSVQAYPTLRLYKRGVFQPPDYMGERTVEGFSAYLQSHAQITFQNLSSSNSNGDACQLVGSIMVDRRVTVWRVAVRSSLTERLSDNTVMYSMELVKPHPKINKRKKALHNDNQYSDDRAP